MEEVEPEYKIIITPIGGRRKKSRPHGEQRRMKITKVCEWCQEKFNPWHSDQRFCSPSCSHSRPRRGRESFTKKQDIPEGYKECIGCRGVLPVADFTSTRKTGKLVGNCRDCRRDQVNARRAKSAGGRRHESLTRYGLSIDSYRQMMEAQNSLCALCFEPLTQGESSPVDHCHKTGKVRGILHTKCNTALGMFKDDPDRLRRAIEYLENA